MSAFNLTNIIDIPTRVTSKASTLLDPIYISDTVDVFSSDVIPVDANISDRRTRLKYKFTKYPVD